MSNLLEQASLVMIPSGYKEDVVYSEIPLDGSGDMALTRASNGTRVNSAGLVEVCPWNFIEYSEQFTSAAWATSNGATVSADQTTAPNGTTTADKIVFPANSAANIYNFPTSPVGSNNISVYAKTLSGTKQFRLRIDTGSGPAVSSNFTATTEWQRFDFAVTTTAANLVAYIFNDSTGVAGDLYVWGAQLNIGSTAKPYFPTTDRLNVPRLTYQNGGGGCPSLLLEKQSTNLAVYSEQFDNGAWPKQNLTVTANATTSPDGTQNADKLIADITNARHLLYQAFSVSANTYTFTTYAKAGENSFLIMRLDTDFPEVKTWFDLSNGTIGTSQGGSPTITSVGGGWYRCSVQYVASTSLTLYGVLYTAKTNGGENFAGNGTDGTYMWGAQLEASSYPTSYIPTTSSSATRVADVCVKSGISSLIGQTEGVAFVDFDFNGNYSNGGIIPISLDGGAGSELYIWVQTSGVLLCEVANSGSVQASITGAIGALGRKKIAFAYKQNDFVVYMNGTQVGTDTSGTVPTMSRLYVGKYYANNTYDLNAGINQATLFPTRLTNAELASLTTI